MMGSFWAMQLITLLVACLVSYSLFLDIYNIKYIPSSVTHPSPRCGANFATVQAGQLCLNILFGGVDAHNNYCTDLCRLMTAINEMTLGAAWTRIYPESEEDTPARIKSAFIPLVVGEHFYFYVWGGLGPKGASKDLYRLDLSSVSWEKLQQNGYTIPDA